MYNIIHLYRFLIKKILMYRNEIQLYYFIKNIVKGGNHGLIKNTPTSINNINKALINSATLTSSTSNIHKNDGLPLLS